MNVAKLCTMVESLFQRKILPLLVFITLFSSVSVAIASPGGMFNGAQSCGSCHGGANSSTIVSLINPTTSVSTGQMITFQLSVATSTGKSAAGMNARVNNSNGQAAGTFAGSTAGGSQANGNGSEVTHTSPRTITGGSAVFSFNWTAPTTPGTYTFIAVGNAVNSNGNTSGDEWNNMTPITITVTAPVFTVSGVVLNASNQPVANVNIALTGGTTNLNQQTNASGEYNFTGVQNGAYTLTPTGTGLTFSPMNRTITVNGANLIGQNFTATPQQSTYSIGGAVSRSSGTPLNEVLITIIGTNTSTTAYTNQAGIYLVNGLPNGTYTITPSRNGFSFLPQNRTATINGGNISGQDFVASVLTYTVSGTIRENGVGLAGIEVRLGNRTAVTDNNGAYSFANVEPGTYGLWATSVIYDFTPRELSITVSNADITNQDFIAQKKLYSIIGRVRQNGVGVSGVLVQVGSTSATTDADGRFVIANLQNGSYTLVPSKTGLVFTPASQVVDVNGTSIEGINFTASPSTLTMAGRVLVSGTGGTPLTGATITVSGATAATVQTNAEGRFALGVSSGTYVITPSKAGFTFAPPSRTVTIATQSTDGLVFEATETPLPAPTVLSPSPADTLVAEDSTVTFVWNAVPGALGYRFVIGGRGVDPIQDTVIQDTTITFTFSGELERYVWYIRPVQQFARASATDGEFIVMKTPVIAEIGPIAGDTVNIPAVLEWTITGKHTAIMLQVSTSEDFSTSFVDTVLATGTRLFTLSSLNEGTRYYWRLKVENAIVSSEWSAVGTFVTRISTSVAEQQTNTLRLSPIPAQEYVNISAWECGSETFNVAELHDITGRVVLRVENISLPYRLNIGAFPNGMYFIRLHGNKFTSSLPLHIAR